MKRSCTSAFCEFIMMFSRHFILNFIWFYYLSQNLQVDSTKGYISLLRVKVKAKLPMLSLRLKSSDKDDNNVQVAGTYAKTTNEKIEPTFYIEDLYSVLGLNMNATKDEIKSAYWSISSNNHPDRNNTPEALAVFRNASYAYKILGKSQKTRSEYDAKYYTKFYINVLEEVGNDVLKPLAFGVALPLINLTFQSIGSFAVPLLKNAYEQSEVVIKAVLDSENIDNNDVLSRTSSALQTKQYEQSINKLEDNIDKNKKNIEFLNKQLQENAQNELKLVNSLNDFNLVEKTILDYIEEYESTIAVEKLQYEKSTSDLSSIQDRFDLELKENNLLQLQFNKTELSIIETENEIFKLEDQLVNARRKLQLLNFEKSALENNIFSRNNVKEVLFKELVINANNQKEKENYYNKLSEKLKELKNEKNKLLFDKKQVIESLEKSQENNKNNEKKIKKLNDQVIILLNKKNEIEKKRKENNNNYIEEVKRKQKEENYLNLIQKKQMSEEEIQYLLVELENRRNNNNNTNNNSSNNYNTGGSSNNNSDNNNNVSNNIM